MLADIEDFACDPSQLGRLVVSSAVASTPEFGLGLALMGFTPIRVSGSMRGDYLELLGRSPLFSHMPEGGEALAYTFDIIEHSDPYCMVDPSINVPAACVIELHLPRAED